MELKTICDLIDKHQDELYQMLSDMIKTAVMKKNVPV